VVVALQAFLPLVDALPAPVRLPSLPPVASAATGAAWAWGRNNLGQLGDGSTAQRTSPVQVSGLTAVTAIAAGNDHSLALKDDGTVWAWGSNGSGRLGDGTTISRRTPVQVKDQAGTGPLPQVMAVAAGAEHSLALRGDGSVWTWGRNNTGQLGSGAIDYHAHPLPAPIAGVSGVTAIAAGANHSLALHADTSVWAWGSNGAGRLGDGTTTTRDAPVQVTQGGGRRPAHRRARHQRRGRAQPGAPDGRRDADADPDAHPNRFADPDGHGHRDPDRLADRHPAADGDRDANRHRHAERHRARPGRHHQHRHRRRRRADSHAHLPGQRWAAHQPHGQDHLRHLQPRSNRVAPHAGRRAAAAQLRDRLLRPLRRPDRVAGDRRVRLQMAMPDGHHGLLL
jgi:hypothetical protein